MYFNLTYVRISTYRCISVHDTYSSTTTHCSNNGKKLHAACTINAKINALKNSLLKDSFWPLLNNLNEFFPPDFRELSGG